MLASFLLRVITSGEARLVAGMVLRCRRTWGVASGWCGRSGTQNGEIWELANWNPVGLWCPDSAPFDVIIDDDDDDDGGDDSALFSHTYIHTHTHSHSNSNSQRPPEWGWFCPSLWAGETPYFYQEGCQSKSPRQMSCSLACSGCQGSSSTCVCVCVLSLWVSSFDSHYFVA